MQAAAGMVMHPPGYLRGVRELTRRYDVLLIADEVAVGFGRTGTMFACEHEAVSPDLLCLAKGLTGGYLPLAATLATDEDLAGVSGHATPSRKTFFHGHTYGGNPLGAAVALATLDVFDEEQTLEQLPAKIARLAEHLARIATHRARRRRAAVRPDRRHRAGARSRDARALSLGREARACASAIGPAAQGVLVRPLGNVMVDHAAVVDHARRAGSRSCWPSKRGFAVTPRSDARPSSGGLLGRRLGCPAARRRSACRRTAGGRPRHSPCRRAPSSAGGIRRSCRDRSTR